MTKQSIEVGDIYEDLDRRAHGRRFRVVSFDAFKAHVQNVVGKQHRNISRARLAKKHLYRKVEVAEPKMAEQNTNAE